MTYEEKLNSIGFMENKWEDAVNQTAIYKLVYEHFKAPLSDNKTKKKAVVIGYDGMTAEMLGCLENVQRGAMRYLIENGGHAIFSFAGGVPYPNELIQETSTAPGWCSMLTGTTADINKVDDNGVVKEVEPKSLFIKLIEDGLAQKTAFYVSWDGHFVEENSTYPKEVEYVTNNGINAIYSKAEDDDGTLANTLADINSENCSDFMFPIIEYPDSNGHGYGFEAEIKEYMQALINSEKAGMDIIDAIKSRPTYESEDWLVLITSDHGGFGHGHGGPTLQERITFIVSNKQINI